MFPQADAAYIPEWPKKSPAPNPLPGTLRYVVLDKDGKLVFECNDPALAYLGMCTAGGVSLCDREAKSRVNTFAGTFDTLPPEGK